jgi:hypothetical protein
MQVLRHVYGGRNQLQLLRSSLYSHYREHSMRTTAASYLALAAMSSFAVATDWCGKWTLLSTSAPGSRLDAKIAFDAARGEVILYGGIVKSGNADVYMGDTWSWNGATWTLRATSGPGGRAFHGMVYDEARQEIVVHGGWTSGLATSTWTWNGVSWTEHAVPGPGERGYLPLAYDTDRQRVVLFGGTAKTHAQVFSDTWEWDGTSWTQVDIGSDVPARAGHTTVYHQKQGRVIVFGGGSSGSTFADGRSWDGAAWTSLPSSGSPSPRGTATSGYLPTVGASVMFGGWFPNAFVSDTTWIWDGSTWSQLTAPGPAPSAYDTMTYDPIGKRLLLLRGSELWGLQLSRSQPAFASQPLALTRYPVEEAVFAIGELPGGTTVFRGSIPQRSASHRFKHPTRVCIAPY